jgi:hypothetical protein
MRLRDAFFLVQSLGVIVFGVMMAAKFGAASHEASSGVARRAWASARMLEVAEARPT